MELSLPKCEITGHDFRRHIELPVNTICMAGKEMKSLPAHAAFKYLGIRMNALGSTEAACRHVCDTVTLRTRQLRNHPYTVRQA
eukprot:3009850-Rhodomonas_salina.1